MVRARDIYILVAYEVPCLETHKILQTHNTIYKHFADVGSENGQKNPWYIE